MGSLERLLDLATSLVRETHPNQVLHLASCLNAVEDRERAKSCSKSLPSTVSRHTFQELLEQSRVLEVTPREIASILVGASHAYNSALAEQTVELVWTGPSSDLIATRKTEQALIEVISSAKREIVLVSFVVYKADSVVAALRDAADRGVSIYLLLEPSEEQGGRVSVDSIAALKGAIPDSHVCVWTKKEGGFDGGKVHAKLIVADRTSCFVSSANLTGHAMEKNMEAGVLIRGGDVPTRLGSHIMALMTIGVIEEI
jgi:cardiolipin synthase